MEALSMHYDKVIICCPFVVHSGEAITLYSNNKISFIELPNAGGDGVKAKIRLLSLIPTWLKAFSKINKQTDIVYQRFPNNLNIPGFFYFWFKKKKVFATYTGTWPKNKEEGVTYSFQKWLLKNFFRGPVFVYDLPCNVLGKIHSTISPSYSTKEWQEEQEQIEKRIEQLKQNETVELKLISVGSFIWYKNQQYILDTCVLLKNAGIPFHLTLAGDGELRSQYENFILANNLINNITLTGNINFQELRNYYRNNTFVVQAPLIEGFGKVPIEGMFHGLIPILNNLSLAPSMVGQQNERGFLFNTSNTSDLFNLLQQIVNGDYNNILGNIIENGRTFTQNQTLEVWSKTINKTVTNYFE
jgi:glycosyltransferase involved in cell wall biosynthesis